MLNCWCFQFLSTVIRPFQKEISSFFEKLIILIFIFNPDISTNDTTRLVAFAIPINGQWMVQWMVQWMANEWSVAIRFVAAKIWRRIIFSGWVQMVSLPHISWAKHHLRELRKPDLCLSDCLYFLWWHNYSRRRLMWSQIMLSAR